MYGHLLTDCWLKHVWNFIQRHNIILIDRVTNFPTPQQENDVFLMEVFAHENYSHSKLAKINRCRLYLGVLTLSDIMNGYGNGLTCAYNCIKDTTRPSHYHWPKQPWPSSGCIRMWKSALRKVFGMQQGVTTYTLGKWFYQPSDSWIWFYSTNTNTLFQQFGHIWKQ